MKNKYLENLDKIEFVVTDACTGRCKHCSQGDHRGGAKINGEIAAEAVKKVGQPTKKGAPCYVHTFYP